MQRRVTDVNKDGYEQGLDEIIFLRYSGLRLFLLGS